MQRAFLALVLGFTVVSSASAQLPSPYELVRGLRVNGLVDLALARLDELKANPKGLSAEEVKILPLEYARTLLEQASREGEPAKRSALLGVARGEFDAFIQANPNHPMAAQAGVEIAKLLSLQAKIKFGRAQMIEAADKKTVEYSKARADFQAAINAYKGAIANLKTRLNSLDANDPTAKELSRSRLQAELDSAITEYDLGKTYAGDEDRRQRGATLEQAKKSFEKLADNYGDQRVGYLANIWSSECLFEIGEMGKAVREVRSLVNAYRTNREAAEAVRLGLWFDIKYISKTGEFDTSSKETTLQRLARTEAAAQNWLRAYPEVRNSPEGLSVRYQLAQIKDNQARADNGIKTDEKTGKILSVSAAAKQNLEIANRLYKELSDSDSEYSDRAQRRRLTNQLILLDAEGRGDDPPLKSIRTLEQGYLAAQVQQARLMQSIERVTKGESKSTMEDLEKEEKRRVAKATSYLEQGLRMSTEKDSPREVFDARLMLVRFLTQVNRATEAAVLGEYLARNNPRVSKAALAAQLAVYAYNAAIASYKESGGNDDSVEEADINRIKRLASFAEQTWPTDAPTDAVRHVLAFYLNKEGSTLEAWNTYSRISTGYASVYQARREMAGVLFFLVRSKERDPVKNREEVKKNIAANAQIWQRTINLLENLPPAPPTATAPEAEAYAGAKTMLAQLSYLAGDYTKTEATVKANIATLKTFTGLPEPKREDLTSSARSLFYNSIQARAADFLKAKDFAKVAALVDPEIKIIKEEFAKAAPADASQGFTRMRTAQRDLVIAAMTAAVQDKKVDRGTELLDVLQRSGGNLDSNIAILRQLVSAIRGQIELLRSEGKDGEAKELASSFTDFLNKLAGDPKKLSNNMVTFLGTGYAAVDEHLKAVELFESVLSKDFVNPGKTPDEQKEAADADQKFRRQLKFLQARSYRLTETDENYKKAAAMMKEIVGDPLKKSPDRPWGYSNLEIRKEYNYLLEAQKIWGSAVRNWTTLTNEFVGKLPALPKGADPEGQKKAQQRILYFDLFYEAQRCSAKAYMGQDPMKFKGGQEAIDGKLIDIAQKFHDLLTNNSDVSTETKDKIMKLIDSTPIMKKKYLELAGPNPKQ